jgi:hypothetical protein
MIWQNPWAWAGLLALAIPVLIHLLGRRSARSQRFPSLRFLEASQLTSTRRTRLTDLPLLTVRMAILAAAVAALAAPLLLTEKRERDLGRTLTRAIIVDTSASMTRRTTTGGAGERALDAARREAARLADEATTNVMLETRSPALAIPGASAWLETRQGRRELIIVSDFQVGAVDSLDIASVPADVGIGLTLISSDSTSPSVQGSRVGTASATETAVGSVVTGSAQASGGLVILAGADERTRSDAARRAASTTVVSGALVRVERPVVVVHRGYDSRTQLLREARPLTQSWQGDLVARLRGDPTLIAAGLDAEIPVSGGGPTVTADSLLAAGRASLGATAGATGASTPFTDVARTRARVPVVLAAGDQRDGRDRLLLFVRSDAGSLVSAALLVAIARASLPLSQTAELEPSRLAEATLAKWRRPAASAATTRSIGDPGASDGRWLWVLALLLLGVETWMRRGRRQVKAAEVIRERAA